MPANDGFIDNLVLPLEYRHPILLRLLCCLAAAAVAALCYRKPTGLKPGQTMWLALGTAVAAAVVFVSKIGESAFWSPRTAWRHGGQDAFIEAMWTGLFVFAVVPFAVMLYRKWTGVALSEAERRPGSEGVRAWASPDKLILTALVAVLAWLAFGFSLWTMLALAFGLLFAFPLLGMGSTMPEERAGRASERRVDDGEAGVSREELSAEQAKVLALLEEGKINARESAELLNALGETRPVAAHEGQPLTKGRKMLVVGAAVVVVGFLLPWFRIDMYREMARLQGQLRQGTVDRYGVTVAQNNSKVSTARQEVGRFSWGNGTYIHGGDVGRSLGWLVLAFSVGAAALPFVGLRLTAQARWTAMMGALGFGAFILLYLLTKSGRWITYGYLLVLIGYAVQAKGAMRERPGREA